MQTISKSPEYNLEFAPLPENYQTWTAVEKQDFLWENRIIASQYSQLPPLEKIDILGLFLTPLRLKMDRQTDEAPRKWKKAIHAHGSVAKIKFIPTSDTPFTGLFQGADYGLIRLSVTGDPSARGFAPGLALKLLVNGQPSQNFSALVSLTGQGNNYNFFANEFSNIVPVVRQFGPKFINWIFSRVTRFPTKLYLQNLAEIEQNGNTINQAYYPYQIFLVPNPQLQFATTPHDFRADLAQISAEIRLFSVYGVEPGKLEKDADKAAEIVDQANYRQKAQLIGEIITTSPFISSLYADSWLFFRHQRFGNN